MHLSEPTISRQFLLVLACSLAGLVQQTWAIDNFWTGANSDSWHDVGNWQFMGPITPLPRIPGDTDTAVLGSPFHDLVFLNGNTAPIDGLVVSNGVDVLTNGHALQVDNGPETSIAGINGLGSSILSQARPGGGTAFLTDNLVLTQGGRLFLAGGNVVIQGETTMTTESSISTINPTPTTGDITFGGDVSLNNSSIELGSPRKATLQSGATLNLRQDSVFNAKLDLNNSANIDSHDSVLVTEQISIGPASTVRLRGSSTWYPTQVTLDGGLVEALDSSRLMEISEIDARNGGRVVTESNLILQSPAFSLFESEASLEIRNSALVIEDDFNPSTPSAIVRFTGENTTLAARSILVNSIETGDDRASLSVTGDATAYTDELSVGNRFVSGSGGVVIINSGASMEVTGNISVAQQGDDDAFLSEIGVGTLGSFTQLGAGTTQIGQAAGSRARIYISDGGTYRSSSGSFLVEATGALHITGGILTGDDSQGVMTIGGPLTVRGTIAVEKHSIFNDFMGGALHATGSMLVDGGTVTLSLGRLSADSVSFANGGSLDFTGGRLSARLLNADLTVPDGGTHAPGPADTGIGIGSNAIVGDYNLLAGSTLEIEIGGTAAVTEHDFVSVSGNVLLDGLLEISLIDSFTPDSTDTFTVFTAGTLTGFFANATPGARLDTIDGLGSFLVDIDFGADQIVLSDFQLDDDADLDDDGDVDGQDFLLIQRTNSSLIPLWESQYAGSMPLASSLAVPEPNSCSLLLLSLLITVYIRPLFARRNSCSLECYESLAM